MFGLKPIFGSLMKRILSLIALVFAGQLYAAESAPADVLQEAALSDVSEPQKPNLSLVESVLNAKQEPEVVVVTLDEVLDFWMQSSVKQEVKDAILMSVEKMKEKKVSDAEIIKFVKAVMAEKSGKKYRNLKIACALLVVALVVGGYIAWKWHKKNNAEKVESTEEIKRLKGFFHGMNDLKIDTTGFRGMSKENTQLIVNLLGRAGVAVYDGPVGSVLPMTEGVVKV